MLNVSSQFGIPNSVTLSSIMVDFKRLKIKKNIGARIWFFISLALLFFISAEAPNLVSFVDLAISSGLSASNEYGGRDRKDFIVETTGNGVAIFDADQDGTPDLLLLNGTTLTGPVQGAPRLPQLYRNDGRGKFRLSGKESGFTHEGWAQGVCAGDYDNDGRTDLLLTYYGHNRLYRNLGDAKFEDVTAKVGLPTTGVRFGSGCTFFDYDRDGRLDFFVSNYINLDLAKTPRPGKGEFCTWKEIPVMCGPRGLPLATNVLYHQEADGTFRDVSLASGITKPGGRYALQAIAADFDNDGWPDLYVACDMTPSLLFHNRGNGTFEERAVTSGVAYNADGRLQAGMGVAVADFNNDGFLDIAKTNFSGDLTSIFLNEDGKFFTDVAGPAGLGVRQLLGWGIAFFDADEDGWRDLLLVNGHVYPEVEHAQVGDKYRQETLFFRNLGNGKFADLSAKAGPALQVPRPARGLALGDLDGDGRPEAVILNMNDTPSLLKNVAPPQGNFLNLDLRGIQSNRSAIGARVTVEATGGRWIDEVQSGSSFYSQSSFTLHFGLGASKSVSTVTIRWPAGKSESWKDLPVNARCTLIEGDPKAACRPYASTLATAAQFQDGAKFQTSGAAGRVDGTSHVSAERAETNERLLALLRVHPVYTAAINHYIAGDANASAADLLAFPANLEVLPFLGETLTGSPQLIDRIAAIAKAHPQSADAAFYLARALVEQDPPQVEAALPHLRRSADLDQAGTRALIELGRQFTNLSRKPEAIAALEEALLRDPTLKVAHFRLAQLFRATGNLEKSREHLRLSQLR